MVAAGTTSDAVAAGTTSDVVAAGTTSDTSLRRAGSCRAAQQPLLVPRVELPVPESARSDKIDNA